MAGAGYKDWAAGNVPTATEFDTYLQEQTVMVFASAAARDTALSTAKSEGMLTFQLDTNTLTVYSGAAWSTVGPVHGAWTAYVPTLTQSGAVTKTTTYAAYQRVGRTITGNFELAVTGAGSANNKITVSLPITARASTVNTVIGSGVIYDASLAAKYLLVAVIDSTTTAAFYHAASGLDILTGATGASFAAALASGDGVHGQFTYEAAGDA